MTKDIGIFEALPTFVSIRKSSLKSMGGGLDNLWDVPRWDGCGTSRYAAHPCRKDWRINASHEHDMRRTRRAVRSLKESYNGIL